MRLLMILWIYGCAAGRKLVNMYCGVVGLSGVVVCGEDIRYEYDIMVNIIIMSQHYGSLLWREDLWTVVSRGYQQSQNTDQYITPGRRSSLARKINLKRSKILNISQVQRVILLQFMFLRYFLLCGVAIFLFKYKNSCQYHLFLSHQLR